MSSRLLVLFLQQPWGDRRRLMEIAVWCLVVTGALRVLQFKTLLHWLQRRLPGNGVWPDHRTEKTGQELSSWRRLTGMVFRHWPMPLSCLEQSLVLYAAARRHGIESDLMIGVRKEDGTLRAHAWVRGEGDLLSDARDVVGEYPSVLRISLKS